MVDGLHREVERHELADGLEALEGGADGNPREAHLRDRGVHDPLRAVLRVQVARHLVRAIVLAHLLADEEHALVGRHLLVDGRVKRVAHGHLPE